ncbi:MAG: aldo/keto reductase [Polyangiaceae bacterium]|nr:aldo/keto reductase [Polyangiaceae bacterium]
MKLKLFGNTGLRVSELCLGTMTFGDVWNFGATAQEISKMFDAYVEAGGNFFDTACNYQGGAAETHLGALIEKNRDRVVVASKYSLSTVPGDPNGWGNHRKNLRRSIEGSLRRLRTDYIDLYQVHIWDHTTPFEDVMSALDDLVHAGKVLHIAVSDAPAWVVARANTWATAHAKSPFSAIQIEYSLLERSVEQELMPMAKCFGLPVLAWSPLAAGVLAGKFHDGTEGSTRRDWAGGYLGPRADTIVPVVLAVAKELGVSASQVALAWVKSRGPQVFPIVGARTQAQLVDNLASANVVLSKEQITKLDAVSAVPPSFPNKMWASQRFVDTTMSGGTAALLTGWERP